MARRSTIDAKSFCKVYVPMAKAGNKAVEIGRALGLKGDDGEVSKIVSQKATGIRRKLKESAEAAAKEAGLDEVKTAALVEATVAKMPKLQTRGRVAEDLNGFLDELLAECDADPEDENSSE